MNPKWFEPGNSENNLSPFEREYHLAHANDTAESISAAFRALLAEDVQANIRDAELFEQQVLNDDLHALRVGDVVRLEAYNNNSMPSWVGREATIVEARRKNCIGYVTVKTDGIDYNFGWETAALTLVRRAGDAAPVAKDAEIARLTAERDALQARIDAGVRVYDGPHGWLETEGPDSTLTAILIDRDHIADPGKMLDERKGQADRREKNLFGVHGRPGKSDRRRVAGTRADRKEAP